MSGPSVVCLRAAGSALVLDVTGPWLPRVLHWGRDVGPLGGSDLAALAAVWTQPVPRSSLDEPGVLTVLPAETEGWSGPPGLAGHRAGGDAVPHWTGVVVTAQVAEDADGRPRVAG